MDAAAAILYRGTGIGTYTYQLVSYLSKELTDFYPIPPGMEYGDCFLRENVDVVGNNDLRRAVFLPRYLNEKQIDLYHVPQNGIGLPREKRCKETVTIHDLIPYLYPETVGRGYLRSFFEEMPRIMERSDAIITVSHCSAADIRRIFDYPAEKIHVIYEAPEPIYRPLPETEVRKVLREKYGINKPYALYVGGFGPRKNVRALILACYLLKKELGISCDLVLPGKRHREFEPLDALIEALDLKDQVTFPGFVPVSDLPFFYNGATVMVYPSVYEGFGLPPLEAMACRTPVIAAETSSLPEVLKDGALWFDPFDVVALCEELYRVLSDEDFRENLARKGKTVASLYQWENVAAETIRVWEHVLK